MDHARVLISDLDGTLLGDPAALARFAAWWRREGRPWRLVYATGRTLESVRALVADTDLPEPDAVISDVGTVVTDGLAERWPDWPPPLSGWSVERVLDALDDEPGLVLQPDAAQSAVKVSYYAGVLRYRDILRLGRVLRARDVHARLVYSAGRFLDVLPRSTGERAAARHVLSRWQIDPRHTVTAGDTGNDRDLLRLGGYGIVVGNATRELRDVRGKRVIHVMGMYADGVLEGLRVIDGVSSDGGDAPSSSRR